MRSYLYFTVVTSLLVTFQVQAALKQSEFGPKISALLDTLHATCITRSGTDEVSINKVLRGEFNDEPKIKAYIKCFFAEPSVIDENGTWNLEKLTQLVPPKILDETLKTVKSCDAKSKGMTTVEDKIFADLKCSYDLSPDTFIFF